MSEILPPPPVVEPPWLTIARKEIGVKEYPGPQDNPRIQEYFAAAGHGPHEHDSVPWCSAFVNWVMREAGIEGTGQANARSWLAWGVPLLQPKLGCVVVFKRPSAGPEAGHVGLWMRQDEVGGVVVLGGNQSNRVDIDLERGDLCIGWRWPPNA